MSPTVQWSTFQATSHTITLPAYSAGRRGDSSGPSSGSRFAATGVALHGGRGKSAEHSTTVSCGMNPSHPATDLNPGATTYSVGVWGWQVNQLLTAIRRKKSRDTIILSVVVAVCCIFILLYWLSKWETLRHCLPLFPSRRRFRHANMTPSVGSWVATPVLFDLKTVSNVETKLSINDWSHWSWR